MTDTPDVTQLLRQVSDGDEDALARLIPVVYRELRSLARAQRRKGTSDTLNTTAIVHEAYERLVRSSVDYASRNHFFHVAARVMRGVIIDNARKYLTDKRGSGQRPLPLGSQRRGNHDGAGRPQDQRELRRYAALRAQRHTDRRAGL